MLYKHPLLLLLLLLLLLQLSAGDRKSTVCFPSTTALFSTAPCRQHGLIAPLLSCGFFFFLRGKGLAVKILSRDSKTLCAKKTNSTALRESTRARAHTHTHTHTHTHITHTHTHKASEVIRQRSLTACREVTITTIRQNKTSNLHLLFKKRASVFVRSVLNYNM